jgi:5-methylcytosine-specific restriction endonuclease McrA
MQKHIKNYFEHNGYTGFEFIPCEICGSTAVDIHHIIPRSKFGSKRKNEQDHHSNLIALCRNCHDKAHQDKNFNNSLKK